mgnify:FL=1
MPQRMTTKKQPKKTQKNPASAKTPRQTSKKCLSSQKRHSEMSYFWGGLGIIICATGALITLLWGIGAMIQK